MPNIIEQQDLLKGLPDNRLAMLMQQPTGDIPPFLVAAEAQRRQAIRQQFAGQGQNESVVDTLTKQLSNVPQNIQAPMQTPPQMPPPQAGIGALQPGMAGGGPVRRFAGDGSGFVAPSMMPTMIEAGPQPMWRVPDYSSVLPRVGDWVGGAARSVYDWATTPYSERRSQEETPAPTSNITTPDINIPPANPAFAFDPGQEPVPYIDLTQKKPKPPEDTTTAPTSVENKSKAEAARIRKEFEALYAPQEPSNWEEAQKWFAMSAAIMNPNANLAQGLVNAGSIYSQAEAEQAAAQRDDRRALKEAMLKWDLGELENMRATEAAQAERALKVQDEIARQKFELEKAGIQATPQFVKNYLEQIKDLNEKIAMTADPAKVQDLIKQRDGLSAKISAFEKSAGFGLPVSRDELEAALSGQ